MAAGLLALGILPEQRVASASATRVEWLYADTLDPEALAQWARAQGLTATDYPSLAADPAVHAYVQSCIEELNGRLNRWETIKDFRILDHDLSVEGDELTPSMKVKRKTMEAKYESLLDSMYGGEPRG